MGMSKSAPSVITSPVTTYTATFSSLTNATAVTKQWRNGQFLHGRGQVLWTGNGGAGAFTCTITGTGGFAGVLIDTTALVGGTSTSNAGATDLSDTNCFWFDSGNGWLDIWVTYNSTSTIKFYMNTQGLDGNQFANGDALNFSFKVPIVGWS